MTQQLTEAEQAFVVEVRDLAERAKLITQVAEAAGNDATTAATVGLARATLRACKRFESQLAESGTPARTPVTETGPPRTRTPAEAAAMVARAREAAAEARERQAVEARIKPVMDLIDEASEKPLHERSPEDRERIESGLWAVAESLTRRRRRSPFWDGLDAA